MNISKLDCKRDPHKARFGKPYLFMTNALPTQMDLRAICPPIVDQGDIGSCTANAWACMLGMMAMKGVITRVQDPEEFNGAFSPLSRLFIYWNERYLQGNTHQDSGSSLTNGMLAVQNWGVCQESTWGYADALEMVCPSAAAYSEAWHHKVPKGLQVDNTQIDQIKGAIGTGFSVVFGMQVYSSFGIVDKTGMVPVPDPSKEQYLGGHANCLVGYDDSIQCFISANSWGTSWGDAGFCYLPYAYLTNPNLAFDFWTLEIPE